MRCQLKIKRMGRYGVDAVMTVPLWLAMQVRDDVAWQEIITDEGILFKPIPADGPGALTMMDQVTKNGGPILTPDEALALVLPDDALPEADDE